MNRVLWSLAVVVAGVAGYLLGSGGAWRGRSETRGDSAPRTDRRRIELPADEIIVLRQKARRADRLEAENRALSERLAEFAPTPPSDDELPVGARRRDGTIVGGAQWTPLTRQLALGFLNNFIDDFFDQANLTPHQRQELEAELERRIQQGMQSAADFINGDITGDDVYQGFELMMEDGDKTLHTVLDKEQYKTYERFLGGMRTFVHQQVVSNELATMRVQLKLDAAQEEQVQKILRERYTRVGEGTRTPIPNMFFKPIRRDKDRAIYQETGAAISQYLRPDQQAAFEKLEKNADAAIFEYRKMLAPK